jgi:hypothetical protein
MTRPASHREQIPKRRCGNCRHGHLVEFKEDLLCFHGDQIVVLPGLSDEDSEVWLSGESVSLLDGDEYDAVWGGRVVDATDICDAWEKE